MTLREQVFSRDRGVCAACGLDTQALAAAYTAALESARARWAAAVEYTKHCGYHNERVAIELAQRLHWDEIAIGRRLRALGFHPSRSFWEMHHVNPVALGGGETVDNMQTLCTPCHAVESADLVRFLSRRPSKRITIIGQDRAGKVVVRQ